MVSSKEKLAKCFEVIGGQFKKTMQKSEHFDFGCSIRDCRLIESLSRAPKTMSELASEMQVTPGSMTTHVDQLIKGKLVERQNDPNDRRKVFIALTSKGSTIANFFKEKHLELADEILKMLDKDERNQLVSLLEKISENFEK